MNRINFIKILKENNVDKSIISFDNNFKDGYCLRKNNLRWERFIRERGRDYDVMGFPTESDALESLLNEILSIYEK